MLDLNKIAGVFAILFALHRGRPGLVGHGLAKDRLPRVPPNIKTPLQASISLLFLNKAIPLVSIYSHSKFVMRIRRGLS